MLRFTGAIVNHRSALSPSLNIACKSYHALGTHTILIMKHLIPSHEILVVANLGSDTATTIKTKTPEHSDSTKSQLSFGAFGWRSRCDSLI